MWLLCSSKGWGIAVMARLDIKWSDWELPFASWASRILSRARLSWTYSQMRRNSGPWAVTRTVAFCFGCACSMCCGGSWARQAVPEEIKIFCAKQWGPPEQVGKWHLTGGGVGVLRLSRGELEVAGAGSHGHSQPWQPVLVLAVKRPRLMYAVHDD